MGIEDTEMQIQGVPHLESDTEVRYQVEAGRDVAEEALLNEFGRPLLPEAWLYAETEEGVVVQGYRRSKGRIEKALDRADLRWERLDGGRAP